MRGNGMKIKGKLLAGALALYLAVGAVSLNVLAEESAAEPGTEEGASGEENVELEVGLSNVEGEMTAEAMELSDTGIGAETAYPDQEGDMELLEEVAASSANTLTWRVEGDMLIFSGECQGEEVDILDILRDCSRDQSHDIKDVRFENCKITGSMSGFFSSCEDLQNIDLSGIDTSQVTDMSNMFRDCRSLTSLDLSNFDTTQVTNMRDMFCDCSGLISLDLSNFNTSHVTNMFGMFEGCSGLTSLDLRNFDTAYVTSMHGMFCACTGLTRLDLSRFDTSQVTNMSYMFSKCSSLTSLDLSRFNTSQVTTVFCMFSECSSLASLDLSSFNTSQVRDMSHMFGGCSSLTSLDLSGFDTSQVTDMSYMFGRCSSLTSLDLSSFDTSQVYGGAYIVGGMGQTFVDCDQLRTIRTPKAMGEQYALLYDKFIDVNDGRITSILSSESCNTILTRVSSMPFADVEPEAWYYSAIEGVYNKGYMSGKGNGNFDPAGLLTRGEIATVLYNMSDRPVTAYESQFDDIPSGQWYSEPVTWVYKCGIAAGYGNGNFGVGDRLTREQLAVMLYQYAQYKGYSTSYNDSALSGFPDAGQVSSWAETAMKWAVSKQIINGTGDGYLKPDGNALRAECASVINGFTEKVK